MIVFSVLIFRTSYEIEKYCYSYFIDGKVVRLMVICPHRKFEEKGGLNLFPKC